MTPDWQVVAFEKLARFRNGKSIKPGGSGAYPVYGSNGIIGASERYMYEDAIILGRVGAYCGSVECCSGKFWASDNTIVVEPNPEAVSARYLYYMLNDANLNRHAGGAAQPLLTQSRLKPLEFNVPSLIVQRRIASILSAYDDLIENNTRRIAILEEMARRLYEEWFVHFRFPGHEEADFVETETGGVPQGWRIVPFTVIADVLSGGTPIKKEPAYWGGSIPFYTPKDAPASSYILETENSITEAGLAKCNSKLYPKDTVFITARGTVGKTALTSCDTAMNQSCYALRPKEPYGPLFLFLALRDAVHELRTRSHGAVFDTIITDTFKQLDVVVPDPDLANTFESHVRPLFDMVLNLQRKNANLRTQRDLLLPKLVSGEIDVSDIPLPDEEDAAA